MPGIGNYSGDYKYVKEWTSYLVPSPQTEWAEEDAREIASNPTLTHILRNPRTGYPVHLYHWNPFGLFGGMLKQQTPVCPKWIKDNPYDSRCKHLPGTGISRRCPNINKVCQMWLNYNKFLQCYNRFEHLGPQEAEAKCDFFLIGVHFKLLEYYNDLREAGEWLGVPSNWKPTLEEEEEEDEDEEEEEEGGGGGEEETEEHEEEHDSENGNDEEEHED